MQDLAVVVLLMLIPLLAPKEGAAIGFATISKALGCSHLVTTTRKIRYIIKIQDDTPS